MFTDTKQRHRSCSWFVTAASSSMLVAACSGIPLKSGALLQVPSPSSSCCLKEPLTKQLELLLSCLKGFRKVVLIESLGENYPSEREK